MTEKKHGSEGTAEPRQLKVMLHGKIRNDDF